MLKIIAAAALVMAGPVTAQITVPKIAPAAAPDQNVDGAAYCVKSGGAVQTRIPTYGTNGSNPLALSGPRRFCQYVSPDGSTQISVLLATLATPKPTLAALAYYSKTKVNLKTCQGGPGSCYCADVGGTDAFGGVSAAGGGWVLELERQRRARRLRVPGPLGDRRLRPVLSCLWHRAGTQPQAQVPLSRSLLNGRSTAGWESRGGGYCSSRSLMTARRSGPTPRIPSR